MIWKIILFFMIAYVDLILSTFIFGLSKKTTSKKESLLEELYDKEFLKLLSDVSILSESGIIIEDRDIKLLSSECETEKDCTNKSLSVNKYLSIMEVVLSINKEYMRIILKNIMKLIRSGDKTLLDMIVNHYYPHVPRIISMAYVAKWRAPSWQIKFFVFLGDLISADLKSFDFDSVLLHIFNEFDFKLLEIPPKDNSIDHMEITTDDKKENTRNVNDILLVIEKLYNNDKLRYAYQHEQQMTVKNFILLQFYRKHEDFTNKSAMEIKLNWESVNSVFLLLAQLNEFMFSDQNWGLTADEFFNYHTLLLNCIQVRILFYAWYHVKMFYNLLSHSHSINYYFVKYSKKSNPVKPLWPQIRDPLKNILRLFSIKEDIYWITLNRMMVPLKKTTKQDMLDLEGKLRKELLFLVKNLMLEEDVDIVNQLNELSISKEFNEIEKKVMDNFNHLINYTNFLQNMLNPIEASFVGWFFNKPEYLNLSKEPGYLTENLDEQL